VDIQSNLKNYITKLQALSDKRKKIVLWTVVIILGMIMIVFWARSAAKRIDDISKNIKFPEISQTETPDRVSQFTAENISKQNAVDSVKDLPDVKEWLSLFSEPDGSSPKTEGKPIIELGSENENTYFIRAYEITSDRTTTFNWYEVNKKNGDITPEF